MTNAKTLLFIVFKVAKEQLFRMKCKATICVSKMKFLPKKKLKRIFCAKREFHDEIRQMLLLRFVAFLAFICAKRDKILNLSFKEIIIC